MMGDVRTMVTIQVPVEHRFAVGDLIYRQEIPVGNEIPPAEQRSVWRVTEVGCSPPRGVDRWEGGWYRLQPVNEFALIVAFDAHGRVSQRDTPLIDLYKPLTEYILTVDLQCELAA